MGNLWLKIRIWMKVGAFGFLLLYALIFSLNNLQDVQVWLWFGKQPQMPLLLLVFITFVLGVIGTILVRTTLRTISQIKDLRTRTRADKIERQMAAMHAKAGRLQTKAEAVVPVATPVIPVESEDVM